MSARRCSQNLRNPYRFMNRNHNTKLWRLADDLKEQLIEKMEAEFEHFHSWLLEQPPEEILDLAYDYLHEAGYFDEPGGYRPFAGAD